MLSRGILSNKNFLCDVMFFHYNDNNNDDLNDAVKILNKKFIQNLNVKLVGRIRTILYYLFIKQT